MKLKNVLIVVEDIKKSVTFYREVFGLRVVLDGGSNIILTEGLVLQEKQVWQDALGKSVTEKNNSCELYFEETNIEAFLEKLNNYKEPVEFVTPLMEHPWGQKIVRFYDFDGNLIEVGSPINQINI